ncbi:hypothetical protein E2562_013972 [Oryza meyeriana var. granulata]|uniref:Uncharacterized protein n=1 Tax=Oryza meyeriana var. granulata TaxID=110450 RepID=A0A6G1DJA5_9ORYZ|nr:hypothetical protein E2562_013972 [Oryza meyeriana var. granulata]
MGSLMAGWNSSVLGDEKKVRLMRNRSLTREEVDAFWRRQQRKPPPEDHRHDGTSTTSSPLSSPCADDVSPFASPGRAEMSRGCPSRRLGRMSSMPATPLARTVMTRSDDHPYQSYSHSEPPSPSAAPHADHHQRSSFDDDDAAAGGTSSSEGWWTRSSWAFLNETPSPEQQMFGKAQTYACVQFHVSRVVTGNA